MERTDVQVRIAGVCVQTFEQPHDGGATEVNFTVGLVPPDVPTPHGAVFKQRTVLSNVHHIRQHAGTGPVTDDHPVVTGRRHVTR